MGKSSGYSVMLCKFWITITIYFFLVFDRFHGYNDGNINIILLDSQPGYDTGFVGNLYQFPNNYVNWLTFTSGVLARPCSIRSTFLHTRSDQAKCLIWNFFRAFVSAFRPNPVIWLVTSWLSCIFDFRFGSITLNSWRNMIHTKFSFVKTLGELILQCFERVAETDFQPW